MRRPINLKKENSVTIELYRNRREPLAEIPVKYVTNITYDLTDYTQMTFEIPSKVYIRGEMQDYLLYEQIKGKMFVVVDLNGEKTKLIIDDDISVVEEKDIKKKQLKAYSYEKTIEKKTLVIGNGATRQLYKPSDETVEISDGILNWFEQQTGWTVGHVDYKARKESGSYPRLIDKSYGNVTCNNIVKDTVIWDKQVNIPVPSQAPLNMSIVYGNMETHSQNGMLQKRESITHNFTNLPYKVERIVAKYSSDDEYRFGMKYILTFVYQEDGKNKRVEQEYKFSFANCNNLNISIPNLLISYETGEYEEKFVTKYRYFEKCSTTWYGFLMNEVSEAYDCIFVFDSFNQVVNVYDKESLGEARGLYLGWDIVKSVNKVHKIGEVVSRLYIESPNCSISSENPLGGEFVECYDYYKNSGIMSQQLIVKLDKYNQLLERKQVEFLNVKLDKNRVDQHITKKDAELSSLQEQYKVQNAILTGYIKAKDVNNQKTQSKVVADLDAKIQALLKEIQTLRDTSNSLLDQITQIGEDIVKANAKDTNGALIFDNDDLIELEDYTVEGVESNDYYTVPYALYQHAIKTIKDMNTAPIEFSMTTGDFLSKIVHPNGWQYLLRLGDKIEIDDKEIQDDDGYIQLCGFTYSPKDNSVTNLKFTNNKEVYSATRTISNIARTQAQQTTMTNFWKDTWKDAQQNNTNVAKIMKDGLDVASQMVRGRGMVNKIDISESGIYVIDATDTGDNKQLYIGSGLIAITTDRWQTSKLAIDTDGMIADTLIGKVILGESLFIGNENNTLKIMPEGIYVYDNDASHELRVFIGIDEKDNKAKMALYSATGDKSLVLSEEGIYNCYQISDRDSFDYYKPFETHFYIPSTLKETFEARLIIDLQKFRAYNKSADSTTIDLKTTGGTGNIDVNISGISGGASGVIVTGGGTAVAWGHGGKQTSRPSGSSNDDPGNIDMSSHTHWVELLHDHSVSLSTNSHSHPITLTGNAKADSHTHSITMPPHKHELVYGIYETNYFPTCEVYLGGFKVATLNSSNSYANINVTEVFRKLKTGSNTITIRTPNTKELGRASLTLFWSGFYNYN